MAVLSYFLEYLIGWQRLTNGLFGYSIIMKGFKLSTVMINRSK
jgi:hypothetical protein